MTQHKISREQGFSAVELLITLFIGALFLISGIQIYGFIFSNGTESGQTAKASNLAYEMLQEFKASYETESGNCETSTDSNPTISDNHGLSIVSSSIVVECPFAAFTGSQEGLKALSKITVTINYKTGSSTESIKQAAYVS